MVVRALLRCFGVAFADDEVVAGGEEPVDVEFRAARLRAVGRMRRHSRSSVNPKSLTTV